MSIERDKDFERLEDIAAMMAENLGIEFENGKYVYYGLDGRTAFAAVYISGAWAGWQAAKAQAVPEGFVLAPKRSTDWQRVNVRDMEPDIEDYENMSKLDWEKLCGEIYDRMVEVGPE